MASAPFFPAPRSPAEHAAQAALAAGNEAALRAVLTRDTLTDDAKGRLVSDLLTALAEHGQLNMARMVLAVGAPQARGIAGVRPLDLAIRHNQMEMVHLLWCRVGDQNTALYESHWVVEAMATGVTPEVRAFVLARSSDEGLCSSTPVNAAMFDHAAGWHDWSAEVKRRGLMVEPQHMDFALEQAAQNGKERSVRFLLEEWDPPANPMAERGKALQVAATFGHETCVRLLLAHMQADDVLAVCKTMRRRRKDPNGLDLDGTDNLAHINRIARWANESQQAALIAHFKQKLDITLPKQRAQQGQDQAPTRQRTRLRS